MANRAIKWGKNIPPNRDSELCCSCCGTPCHNIHATDSCNPHCCTCYPASALEATLSLHNCSGGCNGILGTIILTGPGKTFATGGVAGDKDVLCQRIGEVPGVHRGVGECQKQIGNDPLDPEGSPDLYEMWGGGAYLCCKDPVANAFGCPQEQYKGPDCQGQPFDMSVCCCGDGRGGAPGCFLHEFSCYDIRDKVNQSPDPSGPRDKHCSCPCYSVNISSLPWGEPNGTQGIFCSEIMDHSSSCYSTNEPGCPTQQACVMDITYCQCNEGGDGGTEGWMIKAEMKLPYPLSCDCCPGIVGLPPGSPGAGGCKAGAIIRALIVPVM